MGEIGLFGQRRSIFESLRSRPPPADRRTVAHNPLVPYRDRRAAKGRLWPFARSSRIGHFLGTAVVQRSPALATSATARACTYWPLVQKTRDSAPLSTALAGNFLDHAARRLPKGPRVTCTTSMSAVPAGRATIWLEPPKVGVPFRPEPPGGGTKSPRGRRFSFKLRTH